MPSIMDGRSELQFNIGVDDDEEKYVRHGVAFSLETGRNLPSIEVLIPKIRLFNEFLQANIELLSKFEMWHFQNDQRSSNRSPTAITADLIQPKTFIFLGALQPIDHVDYDKILADFDLLLPLFKFVESNGAVSPYKDSPGTFTFRAGNRAKKSSTTASQTARQLSVELRHNELQAALYSQLCAKHGAENVGTEQPSGSGGRIDTVVKTKDGYTFFEIKVGQSLQACLREAMANSLNTPIGQVPSALSRSWSAASRHWIVNAALISKGFGEIYPSPSAIAKFKSLSHKPLISPTRRSGRKALDARRSGRCPFPNASNARISVHAQ